MVTVDLNCDLGEAYGNYSFGNDETIIPLITSANIACGFHAGDENVLNETVKLAVKHQIKIGAHPGFPDLKGFGRRKMALSYQEIYNAIIYQLGALNGFCKLYNTKIHHVKPHGALYNMGAIDSTVAQAIAQAVYDFDSELILVGLANTLLISEAEKIGLHAASEVFADRRYENNGQLVNRRENDAVITDTDEALQQVIKMVKENKVTSRDGKDITLQADTICVHGDSAHALDFVSQIRKTLMKEGIDIQSL
ncbi:5-oxoprolinase subunit PxpA [Staphylococcus lugdunensis]|uniref:5-oxoprolinase subunit PxpA n=1 Tax=Staphylococcus lugdunensis TaxID=28035 RepID=UPI001F4CC0C1|nr:5-oxoprolinase subunit PxpA [Staphylococcus lugdunensis]MCH8651517.1 5-oxoprolinase subunit PxpA [Staphylococcus lugdunensis]